MKKHLSYNLLENLCRKENWNKNSSIRGTASGITKRSMWVVEQLKEVGLTANIHKFEAPTYTPTPKTYSSFELRTDWQSIKPYFGGNYTRVPLHYVNIEVNVTNTNHDKSIIYVAHHDVNNANSENCQDNSASVCNLISLGESLKGKELDKNVYLVFTDCEEFGGKGAKELANRINEGVFGNVEYVVNLELTANGKNLWNDSKNFDNQSSLLDKLKLEGEFTSVKTPFSDSVILRENNIDSVCIGILDDKNLKQVGESGYCTDWSMCHKVADTFERGANADDMDNFVEFLQKLI
tara:strand:- start:425 stop:1306 length:882 start_codon:yes stop_codon:yes gene_type:complete